MPPHTHACCSVPLEELVSFPEARLAESAGGIRRISNLGSRSRCQQFKSSMNLSTIISFPCTGVGRARYDCEAQRCFSRIEMSERAAVRSTREGELPLWIRPRNRGPLKDTMLSAEGDPALPHSRPHDVKPAPLFEARTIHRLRGQISKPIDRAYRRRKNSSQRSGIRNAVGGRELGSSNIPVVHVRWLERRGNPIQGATEVRTRIRKSRLLFL